MQHYVLKDKNGYVKSFNLHQQDKTVMSTDLNEAHVFRQSDVHVNVLCSMHKDLEPIEVDLIDVKVDEIKGKTEIRLKECKIENYREFVIKVGANYIESMTRQGGELKVSSYTTILEDAYVFSEYMQHKEDLDYIRSDKFPLVYQELEIELIMGRLWIKQPEATKKQIGGNHYQNLAIQPVEYCFKNKLDNLQSNVIKYVTRFKAKNGLQDLQKAKHYIDLLIQYNYIDK